MSRLICFLALLASNAFSQIYHAKEMNVLQLRKIDRAKAVVFLTIGILEEHGPYMPSFTDGYDFGSPGAGTAAAGAQLFKLQSQWLSDLALRILDGFDYSKCLGTAM
jgi:hypothetical protein